MKALVTGASSGIGYDIAKYLSTLGYDIIAVARNKKRLADLKKQAAGNVVTVSMDLSRKKNCVALYEKYKDQDIDILVNGAGFGLYGMFLNTDLDTEIDMIKTNITALQILTKLFYREMSAKNKGKIMNIASAAGFLPGPMMSTYYASKAYVIRLTQAVNEEAKVSGSNVRLCVLCPGPVPTRFAQTAGLMSGLKGIPSEEVAKYAVDKMLAGRFMIVPGALMKAARFFTKILPDSLTVKSAFALQRRKKKAEN